MNQKIVISTLEKEGMYQASKWIRISALLDTSEIEDLFKALGGTLHPLGRIIPEADAQIPLGFFLTEYANWICNLRGGNPPKEAELRKVLACAWSRTPDAFFLQKVKEDSFLLRIRKPVVQINAHFFRYSPLDEEFRSKTFGQDGIFWGLEFSYPFVMQDAKTKQIQIVNSDFENTQLFSDLRKWVRDHTRPTPFLVGGKKVSVPMRMGKKVEDWICHHPSLKEQSLEVSL